MHRRIRLAIVLASLSCLVPASVPASTRMFPVAGHRRERPSIDQQVVVAVAVAPDGTVVGVSGYPSAGGGGSSGFPVEAMYLVVGSFGEAPDQDVVGMRVIDVETAKAAYSGESYGSSLPQVREGISGLAGTLTEAVKGRK